MVAGVKHNTMKRKMLAGQPAVGAELALGCPVIGEMFSLAGFDFVQVDCQHGMWDDSSAFEAFHHICLGPATPSVRVPDNDYAGIGRLLDRGAMSIIVPMVNSPEEAQRAARAVRYPPRGSRSGGGPVGYLTYGGDYATSADDEVLLMVQIETQPAAEAAAEILSVDGVDGCMIGPGDLSRSMGLDLSQPGDRERHAQTIRQIRDDCVRVGKLPGIATGGRGAEQYLKEGYLFVLAMGDYGLIAEGGREALQWINEVRSALS